MSKDNNKVETKMGPHEHAAMACGVEMREAVRAELVRAARLLDDHAEWLAACGIPVAKDDPR